MLHAGLRQGQLQGKDGDRLGKEAELYLVDSQSFGSSLEEIRQHLCFFQGQSLFS